MALFGPSAPTYNQPVLPGASDQLTSNVLNDELNTTAGQYSQGAMANTNLPSGLVSNIGQNISNENQTLGGGPGISMGSAIQNKQQRNFNTAQGQLQNAANNYGYQTQFNRSTQAYNTINQLGAIEGGVTNFANSASIASQGARNAVLGGIFQGAGALAGLGAAGAFGSPSPSNYQATVQGATDLQYALPQLGASSGGGGMDSMIGYNSNPLGGF